MANFLTRTRGRQHGSTRLHWTDWLSYAYLLAGLIVMFGPVLWLVMSSFKTESALSQFPPTFLPYSQREVVVAGYEKPLPLFLAKDEQGQTRELAQVRRIGLIATMVDPAAPQTEIRVNINDRQPVNELKFASGNYTEIFGKFAFGTYLWNSVFITVVATILTTVMGLAPVSLHRVLFRQRAKATIVASTDRFLQVTMVGVAITLAGTAMLIFDFVFGRAGGVLAGVGVLAFVCVLWVVLPRVLRRRAAAAAAVSHHVDRSVDQRGGSATSNDRRE